MIGWLLLLVGASGLYAAFKGKSWVQVIESAVNPKLGAAPALYVVPQTQTSGNIGVDPASFDGPVATVIAYAEAQLGKPYQWAGAGPNSFDCSGLTMRAFQQVGINLPHNSQAQLLQTLPWKLPTTASPPPGALVFFGVGVAEHVGISVGNGTMIEAPHTGDVVKFYSIANEGNLMAVTFPLGSNGTVSA